jgi:hypothetical protein
MKDILIRGCIIVCSQAIDVVKVTIGYFIKILLATIILHLLFLKCIWYQNEKGVELYIITYVLKLILKPTIWLNR